MKVFLRLGGCLEAGGSPEGVLLTRTRWYCLPAKAPVTLWEEAGDGVVYAVSCRSSGVASEGPESPPSEPPRGRALKAGSLPGLVRHLLAAGALGDPTYVPAFLATYRTFAAPSRVLALLLDSLQALEESPSDVAPETPELQRALGPLLCSWLDGYPEDFVGLEPSLGERLLARLRWALGSGSEYEKGLTLAPKEGAPETREEDEDFVEDQDPDPRYVLGLQADEVAAHLTAQDAELFLRLVPHECLGSLWSQRAKKGHEGACPTVRATVAQFNRVANAVVASCLSDTGLRATQRARLLEKWIRVAEECFCLRNFSALYAVVSALQSTPLHRLKRTWEEISRDCVHLYGELSAICSEKDNYRQSRQLLFQEGCPSAEPTQRRHQRKSPEQRPTGVWSLHSRHFPLKGLQDAGRGHTESAGERVHQFRDQATFPKAAWLQRLPRLTEAQSYQLSCAIEPLGEGGTPTRHVKPSVVITHCTDVLASIGMCGPTSWDKPGSPQTPPDLLLSSAPSLAQHLKWPSVSALDTAPEHDTPSSPTGLAPPPATGGTFIRGHRRSASCGSTRTPGGSSECRFIRVRMELQSDILYKSVVVTSQDKAPAVIAKVLEKHNQEGSLAPHYGLVQLLGESRELALPPTANVFYAMNSSSLDFVLRRKRPPDAPPPPLPPPRTPRPRDTDAHATFPKIKATGRKIAKAFF
ncbi:ral guanine nucleotide dissociation stimulator-like 2 [Sphaerodactylus townsendi]|uniref:ral guanine nucleotide dissociation stimulator-like 2 n=1 Tax=Sphaerodactylus townsendi TaxID=933632 RepID=UPI002025D33A|nr:ral guanine nucleotide dissociation stimulator-like 2 [Sphaerodactylus townsendi]